MLFPPSAQTASNVGVLIACSQCCMPHLIYSKHKLSGNQITSSKRLLNDFMYVCGTIFQDVPLDDRRPDTRVAEHVFTREKYFMQIKPNPEFYLQCYRCNDPPVKRIKIKSSSKIDFMSKKKLKTLL